jgi:colanic acid biosynthesis protein WcaH
MHLSKADFAKVITNTPLVSIDLILENEKGEYLLGKRLNRPAKGYWFVPGGRIQKNESLADAFSRLSNDELGAILNISDAVCIGAFDHFYEDNVFGKDFSTHYVAIGYVLKVSESQLELPLDEQHEQYRWLSKSELLNSDDVHQHSKQYFI